MLSYQEHYAQYLGYNSKQTGNLIVCHSPLRDKLKAHREPLLLSFLNQRQVAISVSADLLQSIRSLAVGLSGKILSPDKWVKTIDDLIFDKYKTYQIEQLLRMSVEPNNFTAAKKPNRIIRPLKSADKKIVMSDGQLPMRGRKYRDHFWSENMKKIKGGRCIALFHRGQIVSRASIHPIEAGAGNIGVWTHEKHRKKGYGKAVVSVAVKWCFEHDILPIYWVRHDNKGSIALARSLGFSVMNKEIGVAHWPGDAWNKFKVNDQTQN